MTKTINSVIITPLKTQCDEHSAVGVFSDEGPPVPIPNTAVKLISADNTWLEAAREDKAMPTSRHLSFSKGVLYFALLAQSVEHAAVNRGVTGSSPV